MQRVIASGRKRGREMFVRFVDQAQAPANQRAMVQVRKALRGMSRSAHERARQRGGGGVSGEGRGSLHAIDRILCVRKSRSGAVRVLVRWSGEYPDEWKGKGELSQEAKRAVVKWERQAFGVRAIEAPERVGSRRCARLAERRFRRLRRAMERGSSRPSLVERGGEGAGDALETAADDGGRKRGRVMLDVCEDLQLRGELWRREVVARGRDVRQRTR